MTGLPTFQPLTSRYAFDSADETLSTESESMAAVTPLPSTSKMANRPHTRKYKTKQSNKEKIRAYTRRKTEIGVLTEEMKQLNEQIDAYGDLAGVLRQRATLRQSQLTNSVLRHALQAQRLSFATTISAISQFTREKMTNPFDIPVHLTKDPFERHAALLEMRRDRLHVGRHFIQQHQLCFGTIECCERKKFKASNGDMISTKFELA